MQNIDAIVVPVGGGSIIAGVSAVMSKLNPNCKIIVSYLIQKSNTNLLYKTKFKF